MPFYRNCASISPEFANGTHNNATKFVRDDSLPQGRTMGSFIHLPTGQILLVNGAQNGTGGCGNTSWNTVINQGRQPIHLEGYASGPITTPVLYDPAKPKGERFTSDNFTASDIPRMAHSTALLLPDGSVLLGGSNPHADVNLNMPLLSTPTGYNTTYALERWLPDYFSAVRPKPEGLPEVLTYGGNTFAVKVNATYFAERATVSVDGSGNAVSGFTKGSSNVLAANTKFMVIRPGFATHSMNMGQRSLQLQHSYAVQNDGSVVYTVSPMPTNPNLFAPGPALLFLTIGGVPSQGKFVSVGADRRTMGHVPWAPIIGNPLYNLSAPTNLTGYDGPATFYTGTGPVSSDRLRREDQVAKAARHADQKSSAGRSNVRQQSAFGWRQRGWAWDWIGLMGSMVGALLAS